ncbi:MAG: transposase [Alteromonadaceae bacterium]|nr:transposase [Alteromonadaceae bacterium]
MSWNDLRKGRFSQENSIYFITFVVNKRDPLFSDFYLGQLFCQLIRENEIDHDCRWLTWILMPDHFHGLLQLSSQSSLPIIVRQLKSKSAIKINRFLKRKGGVWQRAYFDRSLRKEDDIKNVARYIVANPLRAKLISNVRNYPFWDSIYL